MQSHVELVLVAGGSCRARGADAEGAPSPAQGAPPESYGPFDWPARALQASVWARVRSLCCQYR
eukprot:scaffold364_cov401-Prasinococcus_capsulatus_cf.AAC.1